MRIIPISSYKGSVKRLEDYFTSGPPTRKLHALFTQCSCTPLSFLVSCLKPLSSGCENAMNPPRPLLHLELSFAILKTHSVNAPEPLRPPIYSPPQGGTPLSLLKSASHFPASAIGEPWHHKAPTCTLFGGMGSNSDGLVGWKRQFFLVYYLIGG